MSRPAIAVGAALLMAACVLAVGTAQADELIPVPESQGPWPGDSDPVVQQALMDARLEAEQAEADRSSAAAVERREASRTSFRSLSEDAAWDLVSSTFPKFFMPRSSISDESRVLDWLGESSALVEHDGERALAVSSAPLVAEDDAGREREVNLDLVAEGSTASSVNPLVDVVYGLDEASARLVESGVQIGFGAGGGVVGAVRGGRVFYPGVETDTDFVLAPERAGVQALWQLRSPASPEQLRLVFALPQGAELRAVRAPAGPGALPPIEGLEIVRGGEVIASVTAPKAFGADGADVPLTFAVEGHELVISVAHRSADVEYPLLVDPVVDIVTYADVQNGADWNNALNMGWVFNWYATGPSSQPVPYYGWSGSNWVPSVYGIGFRFAAGGWYHEGSTGIWSWTPRPNTYIRRVELDDYRHRADETDWFSALKRADGTVQGAKWTVGSFDGGYIAYEEGWPGSDNNRVEFGSRAWSTGTRSLGGNAILTQLVAFVGDVHEPLLSGITHGSPPADWSSANTRTVSFTERDTGTGIKTARVRVPGGATLKSEDRGCNTSYPNYCRTQATARTMSYSTAGLAEGAHTAQLEILDMVQNNDTSNAWAVKIDRTAPDVTLGGSLYRSRIGGPETDETLHNEAYTLTVEATDGVQSPSGNAQRRAGVASARVEIQQSDGSWSTLQSWTNPTGGDNAALNEVEFDFRPDAYAEGEREMRVVVADRAGNERTTPLTIDIQRVPRAGTQPYFSFMHERLSDRSKLSVNTANGNLLVRNTDFQLAGVGFDLVLGRSYNSWDAEQTLDFGPGWRSSLGEYVRLENPAGNGIDLRLPDGAVVRYRDPDGDGTYERPPGLHALLTETSGGHELEWYQRGHTWRFGSNGRLQQIEDQNENRLTIEYDANGRWQRVVNGLGPDGTDRRRRVLEVTARSPEGYIEAIHDPQLDRTWTYGYFANGRLSYARDPIGIYTTYAYTPGGRLEMIADNRGALTEIDYETTTRFARVTSVTRAADVDGNRPQWRFAWDEDPNQDNNYRNRVFGPRDEPGYEVATTYVTDDTDRVIDVTDPAGGDANREYDDYGNIKLLTAGTDTTFTYNGVGENLSEVSQDTMTATLGYGGSAGAPPHYPSSAVDARGNERAFGYDGSSNRIQSRALTGAGEVGAQSENVRNDVGTIDYVELVTEADGPDADTDPDQVSRTDYEYTAEHELQRVIAPGRSSSSTSGLVEFTWDAASRLASRTDGEGRTQRYEYDDMDRLISVQYDSGATVTFSYDPNGNRQSVTDVRGTTTWSYDLLNRPTQETRGGQAVHAYTWDLAGNLLTHTEAGETTSYSYDKRNFPASVTDPDGREILIRYGEDGPNDRKLERIRIEPDGAEEAVDINYTHDESGRIETLTASAPNEMLESYAYGYVDDQAAPNPEDSGPLKEFVEDHALDRCTDYTYDWLGRLTEARMTDDAEDCDFDRDGSANVLHRWQYEYDAASNLVESTHNGDTTTYRVNDRHELCWTAPGTPTNDCANPPADADNYQYNDAGDLLDAASRYQLSYNERGQTDQITAGGLPRGQQYAETGQSQRIASGSASFLYSLLGLQTATQPTPGIGDPLSTGVTRYVRAPDGSLLSQRKPDGTTEYFLYDAHPGSVAALVNPDRIGTGLNPITARFRYDPYGNVIDKSGSSDTPWRFAGAYFERFPDADPDNQTGLYKMGERFYDPRTGRWTQRDPLDQSGDLREGNGHMYAGADPVNRADPSGTTGTYWDLDAKVGVGVGYEQDRNYTGGDTSTHESVSLGIGAGGGISAGEYTGEVDPGHNLTVGLQGCLILCFGADTDTGLSAGVGLKVGGGLEFSFG